MALRLGLTSFGGPVAHIGYFRDEYVARRRWIDEQGFGELVAVTSLLPGPSSSQLGIAIGALRAGKLGGLAAWAGFTLPSAVLMTVFGVGLATSDLAGSGALHGLELAAAAVVLAAVIAMRRALAPDLTRILLAVAGATVALLVAGVLGQLLVLGGAAVVGAAACKGGPPTALHLRFPVGRRLALACGAVLAGLLVALPVARDALGSQALALAAAMVQAGTFVFGGGHVVLPLLDASVVERGWLDEEVFLAGYGAAQALPGPLFTFSAFVGAAAEPEPNGVAGAALALVAIFVPSFLLVGAVLPLWAFARRHARVRASVAGISAAVVGLLAAALWDPVLRTAVDGVLDAALVAVLFGALRLLPPWAVVVAAAVVGAAVL